MKSQIIAIKVYRTIVVLVWLLFLPVNFLWCNFLDWREGEPTAPVQSLWSGYSNTLRILVLMWKKDFSDE